MNSIINENEIPNNLNISNYPKLNKSQENAILKCLKNKFTMIKGPQGKEKIYLCSVLIYHLLKLKITKKHILLYGPSNKATNTLAYYISKIDINYLRILSKKREE
jgi:hypothetical protein